jgi:hypothetical protein
MGENEPSGNPQKGAALLDFARSGAPGAAQAALKAAHLLERPDPALAREALGLALRLEPLDPAPRLALARLAAEQGDFTQARKEAQAVLSEAVDQAARARAAFLLGEIARALGENGAARTHFEYTARIEDALLSANRTDPVAARWFARARGRIAELDGAEGATERAHSGAEGALALLRACAANTGEPPALAADIADAEMRLGAFELSAGQAVSARRRLGEAIARYEALSVTEQDEPHWRAVLADAWSLAAQADYQRGAHAEAREAMDKALQARLRLAAHHADEAWALAATWRVRGALRAALGDAEAAKDSFTQARALAERLAAGTNSAEAQTRFLVHTLLEQTDHALSALDLETAREAADAARAHAEKFARLDGAAAAWLGDLASCWDRLGNVAHAASAREHARDAFARAVELRRLALSRARDDARFSLALSAALIKQGDAALDIGANAEARACFQESAHLRFELCKAAPANAREARSVAVTLERLGLAAMAQGDRHAARTAWEDELALAQVMFADEDSLEGHRFCAIIEARLANTGGPDASDHRRSALARFDLLAHAGALNEDDAALRRKLWDMG